MFEEPDKLDLSRSNAKKQMAFGSACTAASVPTTPR